ncbi:MAG: phosphoribosyltransferase family protein [Chloroflexota bacterium]
MNDYTSTFNDRTHAGKLLVPMINDLLERRPEFNYGVIVGVPRGGVVVAAQVAKATGLPLDIMVTGKVMAPGSSNIVIGAVTERDRVFINQPVVRALGLEDADIEQQVEKVRLQIKSVSGEYRQVVPRSNLSERTVFIIDDNVVTGATMFATLRGLWAERPASIVVALPVAPEATLNALTDFADEVIALNAPSLLTDTIESYYQNIEDVSQQKVMQILRTLRQVQ